MRPEPEPITIMHCGRVKDWNVELKLWGQCMVVMGIFFSSMGIFCGCYDVCLVIGNVLFILGFCLTFGLKFSIQFFMQRQNFKGTVSFGAGFYFITIVWPISWGDIGGIWLYNTFQFLLACLGSLSREDTYSWLGIPTTICQIVL